MLFKLRPYFEFLFKDSTRELKQESRGSIVGFGIGIPTAFAVGIVVGVLSKRFYQRQTNRGGDAADVVWQVFVEYILQQDLGESFSRSVWITKLVNALRASFMSSWSFEP